MKFKIGDKVRCRYDDSGEDNASLGKVFTIIEVRTGDKYPYRLDGAGTTYWGNHELELANEKETTMSKRYYKVLQDTPIWKKGAILEQCDVNYRAINDLWDQVELPANHNNSWCEATDIVENNEAFFERVYSMGKASKLMFVTKEKAQELASKYFTEG